MLRNYLLLAWKVLGRRKFYTFISLFGIAFTLTVLVVTAAILDHAAGPMSPESATGQMRTIYLVRHEKKDNTSTGAAGYLFLDQYVRPLPGIQEFSIHTPPTEAFSYMRGESVELQLKRTDGAFWKIMDFKFVEGGPYTEDDSRNRSFVAVINEATRDRLLGSGAAVGRTVSIDGQNYKVIGVVRNVPILRMTSFADVWLPHGTAKSDAYRREFTGGFFGTAQVADRSAGGALDLELQQILPRVAQQEGYDQIATGFDTVLGFLSRLTGMSSRSSKGSKIVALLGTAAALFMLLPTLNLININVSRILERASEIGVRKAFGASSWTLVTQFVTENVVLTLFGAAIAFVSAAGTLALINASDVIPYADLRVNLRVLLYGVAMALFFGVLSGAYPAWRMSRLQAVVALRGGAQ